MVVAAIARPPKVSATLDVYGDSCYEDLDAGAGCLDAARDGFGRVALGYRLTRSNSVELRGIEPLTYSMRTS
ncbi:hypothetical protein, partial [Mycobacterium sp.]|uniref:hypothetical protein n=1 Tax=Mycobacterium sp. TaxID=1785 RepID=UPI002612A4D2